MARSSDPEGQTLVEIAEYRNDAVDALVFYLKSLYQVSDPRFLAYTREEFGDLLLGRIEETDLRSSLAILAALEAALRIDFQLRVKQRAKDPLSREFRAIFKVRPDRARFDEDLLDPWVRHHPSLKSLVGELRGALHFRHWLAHGRYWKRPAHGRFDYLSMYILAELIFAQFPLFHN
jgi:hypothetical protein